MRSAPFILTICLAVILPGGVADAAESVIKLATLVPDGSLWDKALENMGAEWQRDTDGRVTLRVYPGGVAGDDPDLVRKMRIGQLQGATLTATGLTEIDPAFALFETPLFFRSYEEFFSVLDRLEPMLTERLERQGFKLLHWAHAGWVHLFVVRRAEDPEDLKSLKLFVWAGKDRMSRWWRDGGYQPVPLALPDLLPALKTGMIEAFPATPMVALAMQWFRSAPFMLDLQFAPFMGATVVTTRSWDQIDETDREALLAAAKRAGRRFREEIPGEDRKAIAEMRRRGLGIIEVAGAPEEERWRIEAQKFAETMRDTFVPADVLDRAMGAREEYRRSHTPDADEKTSDTSDR